MNRMGRPPAIALSNSAAPSPPRPQKVALFVVPVLVLVGWAIGQPLSLDFQVIGPPSIPAALDSPPPHFPGDLQLLLKICQYLLSDAQLVGLLPVGIDRQLDHC